MLKSYRGEIHKAGLRCAHNEKIEDRRKKGKARSRCKKRKRMMNKGGEKRKWHSKARLVEVRTITRKARKHTCHHFQKPLGNGGK